MDDNYQHDKKCPKCNKRKVYLRVTAKGMDYVCRVCGFVWKAFAETVRQAFKKTID